MLKQPELLCPAGDLERLRFAVRYGADAVYVGGESFGMRTSPKNFTVEQLAEGATLAHKAGRRIYLTLNSVPTNEEIARLPDYIRRVRETGIDAFIVADLGVLAVVKKLAPEIEVHFSTQVGIANYMAACAAYDLGAKRVVLARELSLQDIAFIRDNTPPELALEAFVHGAMCMSFSGRCLLSRYLTGRDANRGACAQPCRWKWQLTEEHRPNQHFDIGEDADGSYILNANDLCTAPFLDLLCKAGVDSLKIEGRAKTFYYVASTTAAYRGALDAYLAAPDAFVCPERVLTELTRTSHRHYSTGFYFGPDGATQDTKQGGYLREWDVVGIVDDWNDGIASCTQRGKFFLGETLEALLPSGEIVSFAPEYIWDADSELIESTPHAMMAFRVPCAMELPPDSILRRKIPCADAGTDA
ncbi:MAG: U32 family peptidase [Ruthenibacterium sp.]